MIFVGLLFLEIKYGSTLFVLTTFNDALKCWNIYLRFKCPVRLLNSTDLKKGQYVLVLSRNLSKFKMLIKTTDLLVEGTDTGHF